MELVRNQAKQITLIPIGEIKPNERNRNQHSTEQIERLKKIIQATGFRSPLVISNQTGKLVVGHGRLRAARELGFNQLPVIYQDFGSEDDEYAHMIADNAIATWAELDLSGINADIAGLGPDFDIELLGLKDFEIDVADKGQCDEDEVPEHVEPRTKLGDIYQLGRHRLMCGDSTSVDAVEKLMDGAKADMVFTDPPYGIDIVDKGGHIGGGNVAKPGNYKTIAGDQSIDVARDCYNMLEALEVPVMCLWGGNYFSEFLPPRMGWIVWDKRGDMASNNFSDCELAWTNLNKAARCYKETWAGMIKEGESGKRVHPTQKPIALAEYCFDLLIQDQKQVLDLFGGSGSTLIACEKTGRTCFMMELDPHYCDVIVARWEKYTGGQAKLLTDCVTEDVHG